MLQARWTVFGLDEEKKVIASRTTKYRLPLTNNSHQAFVAAQSRMLADLSRNIAEVIQGDARVGEL